ncbi:protein translocase subunit SecD [Rubeoparvulum massiliense]|uniref:protein translocase subunit SecD n=1 Tax=Rubeoparvulum massiliense TaxID=1631346 RepID=UPI000975714B|nr:protein translocase subunit SecD [Rubeoparvulum massiliense]
MKSSKLITFILIVVIMFGVIGFTTNDMLQKITLGLDIQGGFEILYQASTEDGTPVTKEAITNTVTQLEKRVSVIGVAEPDITPEGNDRIRVKLAGVTDPDEARRMLSTTAKLTFRDSRGNILLTGTDLAQNGASVQFDEAKRPYIQMKLKDADQFRQITTDLLGQPLSIYLDEDELTSPTVQSVIPNGIASITGNYSMDEIKEYVGLLNAGALPLQMEEIEARSVGAALGKMALDATVFAGIIGAIFIFLYMMAYYRLPGVVATITLIVYIYLILLILMLMKATLTLPGIAGIILGVGMAVDANILTYERIREEIRTGKTIRSAFRAGSRRSLATIMDANLTTILAAVIIFYFGSSSIQGFAVTLITSIILSLATNVWLSRILLNLLIQAGVANKPSRFGVKESEIGEL